MAAAADLVYLDHAATTPVRLEVVDAMAPYWTEHFGNPSGSHALARRARRALDEARDVIAAHLGCEPGEVVLTGGGTEADNLAITGVLGAAPDLHACCPATEHHAVLSAVERAGGTVLPVDGAGALDLEALSEVLAAHRGRVLVSVMAANNETGVVHDLAAVGDLVAGAGGILHTDAVQAAAWTDLTTFAAGCALVSVAAHKLGGPKGVGALVVREGTPLRPLLVGGGQERDRRSGTQDVAGAVGLAAALALAAADRVGGVPASVAARRDHLAALVTATTDAVVTAAEAPRLPGHLHLRFGPPVESEELLVLLDDAGVCASAGSSCASGALEPSHVLAAMGVAGDDARSALRLTLGRSTTDAEVERAAAAVLVAVSRLRT